MAKLRKAARRAAGKGRALLAALAAAALVAGMLPAAALAQDGAENDGGRPPRELIAEAACSAPSSEAKTEADLVAWLNGKWLPGIVGAADAGSLVAAAAAPADGESDFTAAVDGTEADRDGTDGKLTFDVLPAGGGEPVYRGKLCTIKAAAWEPPETVGDFVVTGGTKGEHYTYADGVLTFVEEGTYTVSMRQGVATTANRIVVAANARVVLAGVSIKTTGQDVPPIDVSGHGATLVLAEGSANTVANESHLVGSPGIRKMGNGAGTLVIEGLGSLFARGGINCAGIGSDGNRAASNIRISGGFVKAQGGDAAAGIGGGYNANAYGLEVAGGVVEAEGDIGIGPGYSITGGDIGQVSISGGTVRTKSGIGVLGDGNLDAASYVRISGGSVEADNVRPAPTHDGKTLTHVAYAVKAGYDSQEPLTRADLEDGDSVPAYYNLTGAVPDEEGNVHLWLDKSDGLTASVPVEGGDASFELSPGTGTILTPGSNLTVKASDAPSGLLESAVASVPGFSSAEVESAVKLEFSPVSTVKPAVVDGVAYPLGAVFSMHKREFIVFDVTGDSLRYAELPEGSGSLDGEVYERSAGNMYASEVGAIDLVTTHRPVEGNLVVSASGAHYRAAYSVTIPPGSGSSEKRTFLYAADGAPAGYYASSGTAVFNEGMEPGGAEGGEPGALLPFGQVTANGKNHLVYSLFSGDVSLAGGGDPKGAALSILANARLAGSSPGGSFLAGSSHFTGDAFQLATSAECEAVPVAGGVVELSAEAVYQSLGSLSPFAVVVVAEDAFQVPVMKVDPWPVEAPAEPGKPTTGKPAAKPLASTGDGSAAAATFVVLVLAAFAALGVSRGRRI